MKKLTTIIGVGIILIQMMVLNAFDKFSPASDGLVKALAAAEWTTDEKVMLPEGWSILTNKKNGEYRLITEASGSQCVFIRGNLIAGSNRMAWKKDDDTIEIKFRGKSNKAGGKVAYMAAYYQKNGKYISANSGMAELTDDWKEYQVKLKFHHEFDGKEVEIVRIVIGSADGMYIGGVEPESMRIAPMLPIPPAAAKIPEGAVIMDFDFTNLNGKSEIKDRTGNYTMFSDCGKFHEQEGALRIAYGARFRIPCENEAFGEAFTISAWILKSSQQSYTRTPVLSRGYTKAYGAEKDPADDQFDFIWDIFNILPGFVTKFGGLETLGNLQSHDYRYNPRELEKNPAGLVGKFDHWTQVAVVYDHGSIKTYMNGILIGEKSARINKPLMTCGMPLYLGATRVVNETDNKETAEMLVRRLRVYRKAFSDAKIAGEFSDKPENLNYTKNISLKSIHTYYSSDMQPVDPEMKKRLPIAEKYLKSSPEDPYRGNKNMEGRIVGDGQWVEMLVNGQKALQVSVNPMTWDHIPRRITESVLDFSAAGVKIVKLGMGAVFPDSWWKGEGEYDFSKFEKMMEDTLRLNPEAVVYVHIGSTPPKWFMEKYSAELEEYYQDNQIGKGKKQWKGYGGPLSSNKWLELNNQMLRDVVRHVEKSSYRNHVYGYAYSNGSGGEWYWPGQWSGALPGYSQATLERFREFLREKYNNDETRLQKAWNQADITFDTAEVPLPEQRLKAEDGIFRNPAQAQSSIDYRMYTQYRTKHFIVENARAIKETLKVPKIVLTYFGYSLYYAGRGSLLHSSGHQVVGEVLASPYLDCIASPIDYLRRRGGEPGVNIAGFSGTSMLNRKLLAREEDLRTHLHQKLEFGRTATLSETMNVIRRGFAYTICDNYWFWFVFQALNHCYHQEELMRDVAKSVDIGMKTVSVNKKNVAEVALIFDEKDSLNVMSAGNEESGRFIREHIWRTFENAHQMGAPFKLHLIDDLKNPDMPDYKLYIFLNPYSISNERLVMINGKVKKNNAVVFWAYAPGYFDGMEISMNNMINLTGFEFKRKNGIHSVGGKLTALKNHSLVNGCSETDKFNIAPVFEVDSKEAEILLKTNETNIMALREYPSWRSVYSLLPVNRKILNNLCRYAGVHIYSEAGDMLLANSGFVAVHAESPGRKTIILPARYEVQELYTGRNFGKTDKIVEQFSEQGTTRIYQLK